MKNALKSTCLALLVLTVAGCGKKPQVPANTIAAAFVDLEKACENGTLFAQNILNELPDQIRPGMAKAYELAFKPLEQYKASLNPRWAVVAFGASSLADLSRAPRKNIAMAIRIDTDETTVDTVLRQWIKERSGKDDVKPDIRKKGVVYAFYSFHAGRIGDDFLVFSDSKEAFDDMFNLYAGESRPSEEFPELFRISGNTLARVSTIPIYSMLTRFELTQEIEEFGVTCEDEDLADMILNLGTVTLDILADGRDIGLSLRIVCGSSGDAKMLEHVFQTISFLSRTGFDFGTYLAKHSDRIPGKFRDYKGKIGQAQVFFNAASRAFDAARDGRIAEITFATPMDMLAKAIAKVLTPEVPAAPKTPKNGARKAVR